MAAPASRKRRPPRGAAPAAPAAPEVAPRIARRERRRDQTREEILAGARRVMLRDGLAATLESVAREVGLTKAALYYYFPSKDALLFEIVFRALEAHARVVHDGVARARNGGEALRAIVRETVRFFAPRLDDFRLAFMYAQVTGSRPVRLSEAQFARIRPLNDLAYGGAAALLAAERTRRPGRARVEPRMLAFLANLSAFGLLTMKGSVENVGDPLRYSDDELVESFARVFEAAVAP